MRWNASGHNYWKGYWMGILVAVGVCGVMHRCYGEAPTNTQVYECRIDGQRVFSDQPCGAGAARRELTVPNNMSAQEATIGYRASSSLPDKRKPAPAEATPNAKRQLRCAALLNNKSNLTSRLRAGYTGKQGERLRDRLRKVDSQYYDLRCSALR